MSLKKTRSSLIQGSFRHTVYDESLLAFVFRLEGGDEAGVVSREIRGGSPDGQGAVAAVRVIVHHVA